MSTLDRRALLKGILYGLLGWALKLEVEAIAATEAAPPAEEECPYDDPLEQLYHDFAVENARIIDREIMSLQGDKE